MNRDVRRKVSRTCGVANFAQIAEIIPISDLVTIYHMYYIFIFY